MCNGEFLHKNPDEAIEYLNDIVENAHTWIGPSFTDSTSKSRPVGVYHLKEEDNIKAQIEALTRQVEALKSKDGRGIHLVTRVESDEPCFIFGGVEHRPHDCSTYGEMKEVYKEQCNALTANKTPYTPYSETYINLGWRNHPNFSWMDPNQWAQSSN